MYPTSYNIALLRFTFRLCSTRYFCVPSTAQVDVRTSQSHSYTIPTSIACMQCGIYMCHDLYFKVLKSTSLVLCPINLALLALHVILYHFCLYAVSDSRIYGLVVYMYLDVGCVAASHTFFMRYQVCTYILNNTTSDKQGFHIIPSGIAYPTVG